MNSYILAVTVVVAIIAVTNAATIPTTTLPIAPVSAAIDPLLQRRINSEVNRMSRSLSRRQRYLTRTLDRTVKPRLARIQIQAEFYSNILSNLPDLIAQLIFSPSQSRSSVRDLLRILSQAVAQENVDDRRKRQANLIPIDFTSTDATMGTNEVTNEMSTAAATEAPLLNEVSTDSGTNEMSTAAATEAPLLNEVTTDSGTNEMSTAAATVLLNAATTQEPTVNPIVQARRTQLLNRISMFINRRVVRLLPLINRYVSVLDNIQNSITINSYALENLPKLVQQLLTSPFQRRLRVSQILNLAQAELASASMSSTVSPPARKRRDADTSREIDADLELDDLLKELNDEVSDILDD